MPPSGDRPDVVLVVLDSVRRDHVSCYGHGRRTTPALDRIAREGVRFTRASAASCWTLPSHASLFTGLYPSEHRADLDTGRLSARHGTLAETLSSHGYDTACFSCNGFIADRTGLTRGFDVAEDVEALAGGGTGVVSRLVRGVHRRWRAWTRRDRGAGRATRRAREWLRERTGRRPFFLFLNYMDCHLPYRLRGADRHRFVEPGGRERADAVPQDPFGVMAGRTLMSEEELEDLQRLYDGCLRYLDRHVAAVAEELRERGRWDRTIFVVTSDHGESFGEHGLLDHQYGLYQELLEVPLVVRLPGGARGGSVDDRLVQLVDLPEVLAEAATGGGGADGGDGARSPGDAFGRVEREEAFAEYLVPNVAAIRRRFPEADTSRFEVSMRSVRTEPGEKLVWRDDGRRELYDLTEDPGETVDRAHVRPDRVSALTDRIEQRLGGWPEVDRAPARDDEGLEQVRERLEALGYL